MKYSLVKIPTIIAVEMDINENKSMCPVFGIKSFSDGFLKLESFFCQFPCFIGYCPNHYYRKYEKSRIKGKGLSY